MLRAVKVVRRVVKRGSADRGQEDRQLEFAQVKRELQDQYRPYSGKKSSDNDTTQYTTSRRIQQRVLTRDRLRSLFKRYKKWWKESELEVLFKKFPCVIATLITFDWADWEDFGTLFFNCRDATKKPLRCDDQLPFDEDALQFLKGGGNRRAFLHDQHIYKPVMLVEDEHQTFTINQRLPFVNPPEFIQEGSYGKILSIEVDDYQLKYKREKPPGGLIANEKTRWALKEITKRESWVQECDIQKRLKLCSTRHRSLLLSFSSFERGHQLGILYPHAHLNLAEFLRGKYAEFPGKSLFKPEHIFHQMAMLAEAFHWMHKQLSLDGDNAKCYHHDFKATNVLVFWVEGKDLAGEWKIIDFGLGHFSSHRARPTSRLLGVPPEPSDASSIIASSRDPGPNSAPEMHMGGQVSASADRYSYGTVYAEILAFFIGGPDMVRELTMQRQTNSDTCFWTKTDTGNFILKPSVDQWLKTITMIPGTGQPFVKEAVKYVRGLLDPNRNTRMKSVEMEQTAKKMEKSAKNLSFAWIVSNFETNGVTDTLPVPRRSESVSTVASRVTHTDPTPVSLMKRILDLLRPKRSLHRESFDKDKNVGRWITLRSPAFQPNPPKFAHYHKVYVPPGTYQTRIGAKSQITSFCSPDIVYLYDIRSLSADLMHWSASHDLSSQNPASSPLSVWRLNAPAGQSWKSVLMAGNFVACWSRPDANLGSDKIYVHEYMPSSRDQFGEPKYDITLGKNCLDVQLSSRGHVVLIYEDHIELRNRNGRLFPEGRASPSVKKASFSNDGDTLCVWRRAAEKHMDYWHFFTIYDDKMDVYSHWKYCKSPRLQDDLALGGQEVKDVILVPFQSGTRFLACDEIGQMIYLNTSGEERLRQSNDSCKGAYMALPCAEDSVALLRRYEEDPLSSVSIAIYQTKADIQHVELWTRWASIEPSEHGSDCGAVTFSDGSGISLIASFPDGTLVRLGS